MNNASFITQQSSFAAAKGLRPHAKLEVLNAQSIVSNWHPLHPSQFQLHHSQFAAGVSLEGLGYGK